MDPHRLAELEAEAQHARRRYDLYRAKMYGPRPSDPSEFRELERVYKSAVERLRHARHAAAGDEDPPPPGPLTPPGG